MRTLIDALCSDRCAGRAAGTPGGAIARGLVRDALRDAGLDPFEQPVPGCGGANVLARVDGDVDRWVIVAAHYDHLGVIDGKTYRGADDNAASVAVMVEVARAIARARPSGRGVIVAAFDGEEPPYFYTPAMGSEHFARNPIVPLDKIDLMLCMELVGHAVGTDEVPAGVRESLFALGAERSEGTSAIVESIATSQPGLVVRTADAEVIPPLSDHAAFWQREVPFLLLTGGRNRRYHTPLDTPEHLDDARLGAVAAWLERLVRATCARSDARVAFRPGARDDASTLRSFIAMTELLAPRSSMAAVGASMAKELLGACDPQGRLAEAQRAEAARLLEMLESGLA